MKYAWRDKSQFDQLEKGLTKYLHKARVNSILTSLNEIEVAGYKKRLKIIDLGCGDGILSQYVAANGRLDVIGVDSDFERLKRAKKIVDNKKIKLIEADLVNLCFRNSEADVILLHHVIEHIDDVSKVLKNCFGLLRGGGFLILGIPNENSVFGKISRFLHKKLYEKGEHVNFYSERSILTILNENGFKIKKIARIGFLSPVYYIHMLLISNPFTFLIGNFLTKIFKFTADSLIVVAQVKESGCQ
ncbi:MAG: class I SAM-dependent methyltransferase [Candidatus Omnitrophica bacterium]|nr:class I SAM-dependent methyltransferase [Candidatus Omnitrophota bacterium]